MMFLPFDNRRKAFVHDYDGVHYRFSDHPDPRAFFADCAVKTIKEIMPDMPSNEIAATYRSSIVNYGIGHTGFLKMAEDAGICSEEFIGYFSRKFHANTHMKMSNEFPRWVAQEADILKKFKALDGHVNHGLLTMGDVEEWAGKGLSRKGLIGFFDDDCLLGFEECGRHSKRHSTAPIELAMNRLNAEPCQVVFIEDSPLNLQVAKEAHREIYTVLIDREDRHSMADFVDFKTQSLSRFLHHAVQAHTWQLERHFAP